MSQETAESVVRIPLAGVEKRPHRTLDERIVVRFPGLARWSAAAWARLPRHSRLRRALLVRRLRRGYAAGNRRDFAVMLVGLDPNIELHRAEVFLDTSGTFLGHDGYMEVWRGVLESFDDFRIDPEELLDLGGDRFVVTSRLSGHGSGSGLSISQPLFQVFTLRRGLVIRQDDFQDRAEALKAAGLSE